MKAYTYILILVWLLMQASVAYAKEEEWYVLKGRMAVSFDLEGKRVTLGEYLNFAPLATPLPIVSTGLSIGKDGLLMPEKIKNHDMMVLVNRTASDSLVIESYNLGDNRPRAMWVDISSRSLETGEISTFDFPLNFISKKHGLSISKKQFQKRNGLLNDDTQRVVFDIGICVVDSVTLYLWKRFTKIGLPIPISLSGERTLSFVPIIYIDSPDSDHPNKINVWWDEESIINYLRFKLRPEGLYVIDDKDRIIDGPIKKLVVKSSRGELLENGSHISID